ncbi:MAG: beta-ketoacyl-[acyl-carrier-protein] synthase family protein [Propionibacteriaceae bacterium]|nr:beta-ketoacyl-[acyl-carrier-protein] synthase family protein [Propionibacteriaceae bacterium]
MHNVVITGMGVVSPIGTTTHEFETNLFQGRHGIVRLTDEQRADLNVAVHAPARGFAATDHFSTLDLKRQDPYATFGLAAAKEAVAQARLLGHVDPYRFGCYLTSGLGGVATISSEHHTLKHLGARRVSPMLIPKWTPSLLAGGAAIHLGAHGPTMSHLSACASSAMSVGEGMRAIRHGYADALVCGGAEKAGSALVLAGFQNLRALTLADDPDRASLPFDKNRAGFVLGEGAAAVVLEREDHAIARGAKILARATGYGNTTDAFHITAPADDGEAVDRAICDALAEAGPCEGAVHVNAHGTGTIKNDLVEGRAIARAFGDLAVVTSTKSMTGHLLGAAGALETIAAVLALQRDEVPPTVGTADIDPAVEVDVVVGASRRTPLSRAVSLSLGFGGHNTCLILEKP